MPRATVPPDSGHGSFGPAPVPVPEGRDVLETARLHWAQSLTAVETVAAELLAQTSDPVLINDIHNLVKRAELQHFMDMNLYAAVLAR